MRALFMDFAKDPHVAAITDEYMYGSAFLVAPVVEQGATKRDVYLPAGTDWYNYWTHQRYTGGQFVKVDAPIDTLPLFVRAGSIVPLGAPVLSARDTQPVTRLQVFPGHDADLQLYNDDGTSYRYETIGGSVVELHWDDRQHRLTHTGDWAGHQLAQAAVEVVAPQR